MIILLNHITFYHIYRSSQNCIQRYTDGHVNSKNTQFKHYDNTVWLTSNMEKLLVKCVVISAPDIKGDLLVTMVKPVKNTIGNPYHHINY